MSDEGAVGSVLFHCWRHDDPDSARSIFEQICRTGLLLTTNPTMLDTFAVERSGGRVEPLEVWQMPRVCFTDIPLSLLAAHGDRYGRFGVGFKRQTIIDWGGLPAWYVPNHWGSGNLKGIGPILVNALHMAKDTAGNFGAVAREFDAKGIPLTVKYELGREVTAKELAREAHATAEALTRVLSFVKEMSPSDVEDHRYLHEREWRIVSGFSLKGFGTPCKPLDKQAKDRLCAANPAWAEKRKSADPNIAARFPDPAVIDTFEIFNGIPTQKTVGQSIEAILVPDDEQAAWTKAFIAASPELFGEDKPQIIVFPAN